MRRIAALLLATLLSAGCMGTDTTSSTGRPCPDWIVGLHGFGAHKVFDASTPRDPRDSELYPNIATPMEDQGRPLDRVNLGFFKEDKSQGGAYGIKVTDARLEMRFYRADDNTTLRGYDFSKGVKGNTGQETFVFEPGLHRNFTIQVPLVPATEQPRPTALRLELVFQPNLDGNPATPSRVEFDMVGQYEYRVC